MFETIRRSDHLFRQSLAGTAPQGFSPEFVHDAFAPKGRMARAIA